MMRPNLFIKKLIAKIKDKINSKNKLTIFNLGLDGDRNKTALVSYLTDQYLWCDGERRYSTNRIECSIIVNELISNGYVVDLTHCNEGEGSLKEYDLILGFGNNFRNSRLKYNGVKILYLTEAHPELSCKNELKMIGVKKTKKIIFERSMKYYIESDFILADKIVCLGENHALDLMARYNSKNIEFTYPTGLESSFDRMGYEAVRENEFLWFGSAGVIHKGLEKLIGIFVANKGMVLHIAGISNTSKLNNGKKLPSNIFFHGVVNVKSKKFEDLARRCNYVILPSASEAVPTGIITCMYAGMIPVISQYCGTSFDGRAIILNDIFDNKKMEDDLLFLAKQKIDRQRKAEISRYSLNKFSLKNYKRFWGAYIKNLHC